MTTTPRVSSVVKKFLKDETTGELTKAALETLSIIAYRAPITKYELEQIRGVNCSLILRNLLIRGLIEEDKDPQTKNIVYKLSFDFLKFLGIKEVKELPDFEKLNSDENLRRFLEERDKEKYAQSASS